MKTYKITNTTNLVGRRDPKYNTVVDIEYIDNRIKKYNKLNAGDTMFLTVNTLPLSIHRLRIKKLITVTEISSEELSNIMKKANPKTKKKTNKKPKAVKNPVVLDKNNEFDEKKSNKKTSSSTKKSSSSKKSSTTSKKSSTSSDNTYMSDDENTD